MFGKNAVVGATHPDEPLWVQEVFPTIQGEGPLAGVPAVFLRLAGCNLRCHFCDTDFESSSWRPSRDDLIDKIEEASTKARGRLVVITGGEPMRQNIAPLIRELINQRDYAVQIETAGTIWPREMSVTMAMYNEDLTLVCSPKTERIHPHVAEWCNHWKYIVREGECDPDDGLPMISTQEKGKRAHIFRGAGVIWLQPCAEYTYGLLDHERTERNVKLAADLCMRYGYRLSLQIHKLIGLP